MAWSLVKHRDNFTTENVGHIGKASEACVARGPRVALHCSKDYPYHPGLVLQACIRPQ